MTTFSPAFAAGASGSPGQVTQLSSPNDCIAETSAEGCGTTDGLGLKGADWIATSPDGKNVYVASFFGNSVAAFDRHGDGSLTELGCVSQSASSDCTTSRLGLSDPGSVTVSPDGKNVYVTGESYQTVMVFTRNSDGSLTSDGCVQDVTAVVSPSICGTTVHGLINPYDLAVSTDGANVYVAAGGSSSPRGAIVEFARANDGTLTQLATPNDCIEEQGDTSPVCATSDAVGLLATTALAVTPDGDNLYAVSDTHLDRSGDAPGAIAEFSRDPATGALTQLAGVDACIGESGVTGASECTGTTAAGVSDLVNLVISPDGTDVYTASDDPTGPIAEFTRGTGGALTPLGCISSGATCGASAAGLAASFGIAASPDGENLYVAAAGNGTTTAPGLVSLTRASNGTLAAAGCIQQQGSSGTTCATTDGHGLADALGVAVSSDGADVYVATSSSGASGFGGAVAAFARAVGPSPVSESATQTVSVTVAAGTLAISTVQSSVAFGTVHPGGSSGAVGVGDIDYTNTLGDGSDWSATVAATDLTGSGNAIPFTALTYRPGATVSGASGSDPGAQTNTAAFAGTDTTPGTTYSSPVTLLNGTKAVEGDFVQSGSTVTLQLPPNAAAGSYTGTLQYTIVG